MGRSDRIAFLAVSCTAGAYILARATLVPMVHDECASVLWFVQPGEWLPDRSHWDANNHYLSTGIGVFLYRALGSGMAILRSGSVVAFAFFAWAAWHLGGHVRSGPVRWSFWAAMLLCPFVLDFFSMFRGYAFSLAGTTIALQGMLRYAKAPRISFLLQALLGCCLGGAAIVALVPFWGIMIAVLTVLLMKSGSAVGRGQLRLHVTLLILFGLAPMAYAVNIALRLQDLGLLYHGSLEGFIRITIASLARYVLGSDAVLVQLAVLAASVLVLIMAAVTARRKGHAAAPVVLVTCVLWAEALARIFMARGFGVNYPEDRAGLHFVPLLLLASVLAIDALTTRHRVWTWLCLPLFFLPARALWTANLDHCLLWPEQCVPDRFMERIAEEERRLGRQVLLGAYHQSGLAIPFAARANDLSPPSVQTSGFPEGPHDLRLVDERFIDLARPGYEVLDRAVGPGLWLLQRSRYEAPTVASSLAVHAWNGADEFHDLAPLDTALLRSGPTWVEVRVPLTFPGSSPDITCVLQVSDDAGGDLHYDALQPCVLRSEWKGDTLRFVRSLVAMPMAARGIVYLYDPKRIGIKLGEGSLTILTSGQ